MLHGHPRSPPTSLDPANALAVVRALRGLGYRPRAPVPAKQLADPAAREAWIRDKGLTVFSLWSPSHPATEIDIFVAEPFPFDDAYARALRADLGGVTVTVASIGDLVALKRRAGRPRDLEDIRALEALEGESPDG